METLFKISSCVKLCCQYIDLLRATCIPHSVIAKTNKATFTQWVADIKKVRAVREVKFLLFLCVPQRHAGLEEWLHVVLTSAVDKRSFAPRPL